MVCFFPHGFLQSSRRGCAAILAFAVLFGILLGGICAGLAEPMLFQLMRTAALSCVSIVCLLQVILLPILFTAFAVYLGQYWLVILVAFSKAFLFGYFCSGILLQYPNSGFLFAFLFLNSDFLSLPVLCWCWFRSIRSREAGLQTIIPAVFLFIGIAFLNYQVVSPFLASLLS